ncbi:MAG: outer membrane protein assembly factor BamB [Steroidobacteraceae bacterium]
MNQAAMLRRGALVISLVLAASCASNKDDKPAKLTEITPTLAVQRSWDVKLGAAAPKLRLGLTLASLDNRFFAANHGGEVSAFETATGKRVWRTKLKAPLSAGPGAGNGLVVVGSSKGDLIALDAATGAKRWGVKLASEVLSAPAVAGDLVLARTVDGKLHGLAVANGDERWAATEQVPRLSLRGTGETVISDDLAISGFDNGRLVAVNLANGNNAWEATVAQPRGSSELQRLVDVDGTIVVSGTDVFAVSYQGRAVRVARDTGQVLWTRDLSSYRGLAADDSALYVSTTEGDVVRLDRRTGAEVWRQKALARRALSAPVIMGSHVVVADYEGVVHWLDAASGDFQARAETKARVSAPPVVLDDELLVLNDEGKINAYRISAPLAQR